MVAERILHTLAIDRAMSLRPNMIKPLPSCEVQRTRRWVQLVPELLRESIRVKASTDKHGKRWLCWLWTGRKSKNGYARFRLNGKEISASRLLYHLFVGHVPMSRELDHLCPYRFCVNPDHLESVTPKENYRRRDARNGVERVRETNRRNAMKRRNKT